MALPVTDYTARDLVGYGAHPPRVEWPGGARIAINVVVNYEEGGEPCVLHGDPYCLTAGRDGIVQGPQGIRDLNIESEFDYGARVGVWRMLRVFRDYDIRASFLVVGKALESNPEVARAIGTGGHEPIDHGYRWSYLANLYAMSREQEREFLRKEIEVCQRLIGQRPVGHFVGQASLQTRELLLEEGYLYDSNFVASDLPMFVDVKGRRLLLVPYGRTLNDAQERFALGEEYFRYGKEVFDRLYKEGAKTPKMMTVSLHSRICGTPGFAAAVARFIGYAKSFSCVWFARRDEIARVWLAQFGDR
jgi:peptidoglycan/xylan/chitin deacetylase (PgdA/CDA1 family)